MENDLISRSALLEKIQYRPHFKCMSSIIVDGCVRIIRRTIEKAPVAATSPCDLCRFSPPSSTDGKPCVMCVAERREENAAG